MRFTSAGCTGRVRGSWRRSGGHDVADDYALTQDLYTFGGCAISTNLFNGFDYQASVAAGWGTRCSNTKSTMLDVQVGVGYKELRPEELTKAADGR